MITALVQIKLPEPMATDKAQSSLCGDGTQIQGSKRAYSQVLPAFRGWRNSRRGIPLEITGSLRATLYR